MKVRKGVCYFGQFSEAKRVREAIPPGSRIVGYQIGYAVQFEKGGRYVGLSDLVAFCGYGR